MVVPVHAALQQKRIKGAALDVCEVEPLPEDSPLWTLDNVLLSPHCADRTADFQVRLSKSSATPADQHIVQLLGNAVLPAHRPA